MKFKLVCILFNVVLAGFLAILCAAPLFMPGFGGAPEVWRSFWPLIIILILFLIGFDAFYLVNRELYLCLEREDWPALSCCLEERVLKRGDYSPRLVKILAETYLALADCPAVLSLENKIAIVKPRLLSRLALLFGAARVLAGDFEGAARFFAGQEEEAKVRKAPKLAWLGWYRGFALLLGGQSSQAADAFIPLAYSAPEPLVTALAAYFLGGSLSQALPLRSDELEKAAAAGRERVLKALAGKERWAARVRKTALDIHAVVLSRYLEKTEKWLYG